VDSNGFLKLAVNVDDGRLNDIIQHQVQQALMPLREALSTCTTAVASVRTDVDHLRLGSDEVKATVRRQEEASAEMKASINSIAQAVGNIDDDVKTLSQLSGVVKVEALSAQLRQYVTVDQMTSLSAEINSMRDKASRAPDELRSLLDQRLASLTAADSDRKAALAQLQEKIVSCERLASEQVSGVRTRLEEVQRSAGAEASAKVDALEKVVSAHKAALDEVSVRVARVAQESSSSATTAVQSVADDLASISATVNANDARMSAALAGLETKIQAAADDAAIKEVCDSLRAQVDKLQKEVAACAAKATAVEGSLGKCVQKADFDSKIAEFTPQSEMMSSQMQLNLNIKKALLERLDGKASLLDMEEAISNIKVLEDRLQNCIEDVRQKDRGQSEASDKVDRLEERLQKAEASVNQVTEVEHKLQQGLHDAGSARSTLQQRLVQLEGKLGDVASRAAVDAAVAAKADAAAVAAVRQTVDQLVAKVEDVARQAAQAGDQVSASKFPVRDEVQVLVEGSLAPVRSQLRDLVDKLALKAGVDDLHVLQRLCLGDYTKGVSGSTNSLIDGADEYIADLTRLKAQARRTTRIYSPGV